MIGGGYPLGRVVNIVGDKSTGKTLLAIEACANFASEFPEGRIWYREVEAAFDVDYAEKLGLPSKRVEFNSEPMLTVEDVFEDLTKCIESTQKEGLYIIDSLDALSDRSEMDRDIDEGTFGANKAKQLSQMFRRLIQKLGKSNITVIVISQVRENIGVTFGRKTTRSGGKALDFYASQVIFLAQTGQMKRTIRSVERPIGVRIKAKCDKNKIGMPFRECEFPIIFGFGVDDLAASVAFLESVGALSEITDKKSTPYLKSVNKLDDDAYFNEIDKVTTLAESVWGEIEEQFMPERRKYEERRSVPEGG